MLYLLIATLIFGVLTGWAFYAAQHSHGDDFGAVVPFLFCGAVFVVLVIVYLALAFWNHRFF